MRPTSARRSFVLLFLDSAFLFFLSYCLYYYVYSLRSPSGEWAGNKQLAQRRIITITWCRHLYDICLSFSFLFSHQRRWWAPWLRDRGRLAGLAIDVVHVRCVLRTTWKLCSCSQRIFYYYIVVGDVCCCFSAGRDKKKRKGRIKTRCLAVDWKFSSSKGQRREMTLEIDLGKRAHSHLSCPIFLCI